MPGFIFRLFIVISLTLLGSAPTRAADKPKIVDQITRQLTAQGYEIEEVRRTFLGRIVIEAERGNIEREMVINPRTGEILRDLLERETDDDDAIIIGGAEDYDERDGDHDD